ncbi:MAG TPA: hypothetical protein ENI99_07835 [Sedimenticola sp.]|nr:hypothetical protein [Sedimenticola sp.]
MAILFLSSVLAIISLSSLAWYFARKRDTWFDWDWMLSVAPVTLWFALISRGIGPQGPDQIIELVFIAGAIPLLLSLRVFALDALFQNARRNSIFIFVVCMVLPIAVRFTMPAFL